MAQGKLTKQLASLPSSPGIYLFKDKNELVLYVGKAANLRSRVRSYFQRTTTLSPHKQMMVKKIASIETMATDSEAEALVLESVLIKKHRPSYNVVLKDDKNYQFIKIDYRHPWPTITTVRRPELDRGRSQARYFGPYTSASDLYEALRLLRRIFPWRKKPKEPTRFEQDLLQKRTLCPLPQTDEEYREMITRLACVLEGKSDEVLDELTKRMKMLSDAKQYEQAARLRNQITALKHIQAKQKIISLKGESQDVVALYRQDDIASVNVFVIRAGKLIDKLNFILQHVRDENDTAVLDAFLKQYYSEATNPPKEIIIPTPTSLTTRDILVIARESAVVSRSETKADDRSNPLGHTRGSLINAQNVNLSFLRPLVPMSIGKESRSPTHLTLDPRPRFREGMLYRGDDKEEYVYRNDIKITLPHHGKKRALIKLGEENARQYLEQSLASWEKGRGDEALNELKRVLRLPDIPRRIEGYDISNIQGKLAVGSMVVFTDGLPDKNQYRKFKIKTVAGANDPLMLAEVLKRRFTHSEWPQPDLVLLDGGKGQLAIALKAIFGRHPELVSGSNEEHKVKKIPKQVRDDNPATYQFIALAKREEKIFQGVETPHWGVSTQKINLHPRSPASLLLQRVRDEAHRFAQSYYHLRHSKAITA